ncbi:hypothetical protein EGW08_017989, partial [Elysia chlorotica]
DVNFLFTIWINAYSIITIRVVISISCRRRYVCRRLKQMQKSHSVEDAKSNPLVTVEVNPPGTTMMMMKKNHSSHAGDYMIMKMSSEESQQKQMYTKWFNVDRPWALSTNQLYGNGDYESVHNIRNFFSQICENLYEVAEAECRLTGRENEIFTETRPLQNSDDVLHTPCTKDGLICRAEDQAPGRMCGDYSVRFLCTYVGKKTKEEGSDNLFPEFDARIYLVLAIVPVLIFLIRLVWAYIFRQRRRARRRLRREQRRRRSQALRGQGVGDEDDEDGDDDVSINSDLARPPPAYQDLFSDGTPSGVFTISGTGLEPCVKCKDARCSLVDGAMVTAGIRLEQQQHQQQQQQQLQQQTSLASCTSTSSSSPSCSADSGQDVPDGGFTSRDQSEIPLESLGSSLVQVVTESSSTDSTNSQPESRISGSVNSLSESSNDDSSSSQSESSITSPSTGDSVTVLIPAELSVPADVPSPCACACHRAGPFGGRGVSGYDNPGFSHDVCSASPSGVPGPYRGRHVSAIPRNVSDISVLSQITLSELPTYEDALRLEKKLAKEAAME